MKQVVGTTWIGLPLSTRFDFAIFNAACSGPGHPMRFIPSVARWWSTASVTPKSAACPGDGQLKTSTSSASSVNFGLWSAFTALPFGFAAVFSTRVPFGTGAETEKLTRGTTLTLYHPDCFASVREVASQLRRLSESPHFSSADALTPLGPSVQRFLESQGAVPAWQALAVQAPNPQTRLRRFHEWFDGFRTLKLMHHVRDHGAVSLPWQDAVGRAPFINDIDDDGSCLSEARTELLRLEQAQPRLVGPSLP